MSSGFPCPSFTARKDDMILDIRTGDETIHLELTGKTKTLYTPPLISEKRLQAFNRLYDTAVGVLKASRSSGSLANTILALEDLQSAVDSLAAAEKKEC
jgi:hypothetical protein